MANTTESVTPCSDRWNFDEVWKVVLWSVFFGIESLVIFVVNSLALFIFQKRTFLVKKSTYLLINLTIADFLVGITAFLCIPVIIFDSEYLSAFHILSIPIPLFGSLFFMTAIAVERVYATFRPFRHRFLAKRNYLVVIAFIWSLVGVISMLIFAAFGLRVWNKSSTRKPDLVIKMLSVLLSAISLIVICICYVSLWVKIRFFKTMNFQNLRTIHENNKLAKTLFIMTIISLLAWLPKIGSIGLNKKYTCVKDKSITVASFSILFMNSFINFVVYLIRMREFKNELENLIRRCSNVDMSCTERNRPIRPRSNRVEDAL
jgi:hypothetical protein